MKKNKAVKCSECYSQHECCRIGAWVDLEEAKKILSLKIRKGDFFHLEKDDYFPSGYKVGTSPGDEPCTFLTKSGLCAIHRKDYSLKPTHCKEFPYEKNKLSPIAKYLCVAMRKKSKK